MMLRRWIFPRVVLLLFVLASGAYLKGAECSPPASMLAKLRAQPNSAAYSEVGTWFGNHKQFGCAAEAYRSALKAQAASPRILYLLGLSLFSAGRPEEAIAPLQQSIEVSPNVLQPHVILASALEKSQRNAEAKAEWEAALKIAPHSALALDGLARALLREGRSSDVLTLLGPAPTEETLIVDLAQGYINLKQFEEASRLLTDRLKRYPSSMRISNTMTRLEIQQHHTQAAERIAERTARLHPSDSETQQLYLQALVFAGNLQAAKPLARKLLDEAPQDVVLLYLNGVLEHDAGDLQAARTYLEKAVSADPADPAPRYNLGQVLAQLNEPQGAKEQLEKALELGATEPEVHLELAKALRVLGETQAAAEHLKLYQQELRGRQTRAMAVSKTAQADKALAAGDPQKAT